MELSSSGIGERTFLVIRARAGFNIQIPKLNFFLRNASVFDDDVCLPRKTAGRAGRKGDIRGLAALKNLLCMRPGRFISGCLLLANLAIQPGARAGGVTVVTHGFELDSSFPTWVAAMAEDIPAYPAFPGTNFTIYKISISYNSGYLYTLTRVGGSAPAATDSGEIIVELDWSALSGNLFSSYASTANVATAVSQILMLTNLTPELNGHALGEFPVHLVGHSRGGSLVAETSRQLGTNGIWVDHLTTLDPYPLNNDGNSDFPASVVDAPAKYTYANVLFADNYWQDLGLGIYLGDPDGEPVSGAYVRQLTDLSGGYFNVSSTSAPDHSNVHLWYHGTVSLVTPTSDSSASITSTERQAWWTGDEQQGTNAGFEYSLIAGGNRLSPDTPAGPGYPAIVDGFNQWWDLGAGTAANRTALAANNGSWPSLIRFDRVDTNFIVQGQNLPARFYYQWAQPAASNATLSVYLDDDFNPLNTNQTLLTVTNLPGTGASSIGLGTISIPFAASNTVPGWHSLYAVIGGGGRTRLLYAPELVNVLSIYQPPVLGIGRVNSSQFVLTINALPGQTVVLQGSPDLAAWQPLATNLFSTNAWTYTNTISPAANMLFFRVTLAN
jgi:hypothetical protein